MHVPQADLAVASVDEPCLIRRACHALEALRVRLSVSTPGGVEARRNIYSRTASPLKILKPKLSPPSRTTVMQRLVSLPGWILNDPSLPGGTGLGVGGKFGAGLGGGVPLQLGGVAGISVHARSARWGK